MILRQQQDYTELQQKHQQIIMYMNTVASEQSKRVETQEQKLFEQERELALFSEKVKKLEEMNELLENERLCYIGAKKMSKPSVIL